MEEKRKKPDHYWIARLREGDAKIGESWQFAKGLEEGLENGEGIYSSYYRYDKNKRNAEVTKYFKAVREVKPGDLLLIAWGNRIHAYCYVEEHHFDCEQKWSIEKILNREEHNFKSGRICFCDSKVFFEDYNDKEQNWRQCIKVEGFIYGDVNSSVTTRGVRAACIEGGNPRNTLFKVREDFAEKKKTDLERQYEDRHKDE